MHYDGLCIGIISYCCHNTRMHHASYRGDNVQVAYVQCCRLLVQLYMHMQFPCKKVSTRTCVRYLDYYASLPVTTTTIGRRRKHTSSPRSFPSLSCVLKVPSSAHLSQMASSALAKSRAGGRELMVPGWLVSVVWELLLVASWLPVPEWHVLVLRSNTS